MAIPGVLLILLRRCPPPSCSARSGARYRDMQQIIASIVQLVFFVTRSSGSRSCCASTPGSRTTIPSSC
jgi:hypothetical protein